MKNLLLASIGILVVATSTASLASARDDRPHSGVAQLSANGDPNVQLAWDARKRDEHADRSDDEHDDERDERNQSQRSRTADGFGQGMQAVSITAGPGQPGNGWRYFTDPAAGLAVVISPQGTYFLNRGDGLSQLAVPQSRS